jgi:MFS family permease
MHRASRPLAVIAHWFQAQGTRAAPARRGRSSTDANFGAFIANGFFFPIAGKILGTGLLLTWFVSDLTPSAFVAGLLIPIQYGISLLAQPWIGQAISERSARVKYYVAQALVRAAVWFGLGLASWLIGEDHPLLLLVIFFTVVLADAVAAGVGNISFSETLARVIPQKLRGRARGFRGMAGAVLGGIAGLLLHLYVPEDAGVRLFGLLFAIAGVLYAIGGAVFGLIRDPKEHARPARAPKRESILTRVRHMLAHSPYRRFLAIQILLTPATQGLVFFTLLGRHEFDLNINALGLLIVSDALAPLAGNFFAGLWADRFGNRWALQASALASLVAPLAALVLLFAGRGWPPWAVLATFGLIVFAIGVAYSGFDLASKNLLLDLAPDERSRPVYIGMNDTLLALPTTLFIVGGAAIDWFGFAPVFVAIALLALVAAILGSAAFSRSSPHRK